MIDQLRKDLIADEGLRLRPYTDTVGKVTIGVGRNIDDRGITRDEAMLLLDNDMAVAFRDLDRNVPWWRDLPEPAQRGLANMCFNIGWPRLSRFNRMLTALEGRHFHTAAEEALASLWREQVGARAHRVARLFKECAI